MLGRRTAVCWQSFHIQQLPSICIRFQCSFYRYRCGLIGFWSVLIKPRIRAGQWKASVPTRPAVWTHRLARSYLWRHRSMVNCPSSTVRDQSPFPSGRTPGWCPRRTITPMSPDQITPVSHTVHYLGPESQLTREWLRLLLYWLQYDAIWDASQVAEL